MDENKKWFAVYTKPRFEKRVTEILTRKKIENYCPINKVLRHWSDRTKLVTEPLFPYFVFIKITQSELSSLKQIDGVVNFVYWLGKPAIIRDSEIEAIRQFLDEHSNIRLEKIQVTTNEPEHVNGSFAKMGNGLIALKNKSVKVELPSLGFMMVADSETTDVDVMVRTIAPKIKLSYFKYAFK
jgi:transcription termination/antitermination protein NusG